MNIDDVKRNAFAMPLTSPAFPPGPYRFVNREFLIVTYRTDLDALCAVVPERLQITEPIVKYEFIRMPDSTGFGDYTESGQVIPDTFDGVAGGYVHSMCLNEETPIAGGRKLWGLFEEAGIAFAHGRDRHLARHAQLRLGARGHRPHGLQAHHAAHRRDPDRATRTELPAEDHPARRRRATHLRAGALLPRRRDGQGRLDRPGRTALELAHRALAPVAQLPVLEVISDTHLVTDMTLGLGSVIHDNLA